MMMIMMIRDENIIVMMVSMAMISSTSPFDNVDYADDKNEFCGMLTNTLH